MLKKLKRRNKIVTRDPLNTKPCTVSAIVDADAVIVVGLKSNHFLLEEAVITSFEYVDKGGYRHDGLYS